MGVTRVRATVRHARLMPSSGSRWRSKGERQAWFTRCNLAVLKATHTVLVWHHTAQSM
jgi:hypothetical protein